MDAITHSVPISEGRFVWLWAILKEELSPYPGRASLVGRMVAASTLVMIIGMTFRIPYIAYAAIYALILSRESLEGTASEARALVVGSALGGTYAVLGALIALGDPMLRFLWVGGTLFLAFYSLSALSSYTTAARFAYLIVITIPLWDSHASAESKLESTLWAVGALTIASVTTLLLEMVFASFRQTDDLIEGVIERLLSVEELVTSYADGYEIPAVTQATLMRLATVGTSRLRRILYRSDYKASRKQQMGALLALVGRLVDIGASLSQFGIRVVEPDRGRIRKCAQNIAEIRDALTSRAFPRVTRLSVEVGASPGVPLLGEMERTVSLIQDVFTSAQSVGLYAPTSSDSAQTTPLLRDSLRSPEHVRFALRGCLAAGLGYITYNALFWPGIATVITTCFLTALTTIGASHQKQFLRLTGAVLGGPVIGIGAQIFILPNIDSIGGFILLYAAVAGLSAWIATSSSRISYIGVQVAAAFCLINLQEFKFQTSLVVARDRVVGIFLGLLMMWLAFDWLWSAPAGVEMKKAFVSAIRSLAQLAREPVSADLTNAIERSYVLRETINAQFDKVRTFADGVLFEFGPSRRQDLALRDQIRRWQPELRALFVMRIALMKYRLRLEGFELPEKFRQFHQDYDRRSASILEDLADVIEDCTPQRRHIYPDPINSLEERLRECCPEASEPTRAAHVQTFLTLVVGVDRLTTSLAEAVASASGIPTKMDSSRPSVDTPASEAPIIAN